MANGAFACESCLPDSYHYDGVCSERTALREEAEKPGASKKKMLPLGALRTLATKAFGTGNQQQLQQQDGSKGGKAKSKADVCPPDSIPDYQPTRLPTVCYIVDCPFHSKRSISPRVDFEAFEAEFFDCFHPQHNKHESHHQEIENEKNTEHVDQKGKEKEKEKEMEKENEEGTGTGTGTKMGEQPLTRMQTRTQTLATIETELRRHLPKLQLFQPPYPKEEHHTPQSLPECASTPCFWGAQETSTSFPVSPSLDVLRYPPSSPAYLLGPLPNDEKFRYLATCLSNNPRRNRSRAVTPSTSSALLRPRGPSPCSSLECLSSSSSGSSSISPSSSTSRLATNVRCC